MTKNLDVSITFFPARLQSLYSGYVKTVSLFAQKKHTLQSCIISYIPDFPVFSWYKNGYFKSLNPL